MVSRWLNLVVVVFWLTTMSWLVVKKILPPLRVGEPPNYRSVVFDEPVCWRIALAGVPDNQMQDRTLGWAANRVVRRDDSMVYFQSRVYFQELPLNEVSPAWLNAVLRPLLRGSRALDMDARSRLEIDPLGRLVGFESKVRLADIPDAIRMQGQIDGTQLKVSVRSGDWVYKTEKYLPSNALVGDELSPQARLPNLRLGQTWTMPVYSPFRAPNSPMEILQARVQRKELIIWNGRSIDTLLVTYSNDDGSTTAGDPRGKLWVRMDGMVVKQEVNLFNCQLQFVRMSEKRERELAASLGTDWWAELSSLRAHQLLELVDRP